MIDVHQINLSFVPKVACEISLITTIDSLCHRAAFRPMLSDISLRALFCIDRVGYSIF